MDKNKLIEMIEDGTLESELSTLGYDLVKKKEKSYTVSAHYDYIDTSGGNGIVFMNLNQKEYDDFCKMTESEQRELLENEGESEAYDVDIDDYGSLGELHISD